MSIRDFHELKKMYEAGMAIHGLDHMENGGKEIKSALDTLKKDFKRLENLILSQRLDGFEKANKIDKYFYYEDDKPLHGSDELCQKLADLVNEKGVHIINMSRYQAIAWVKPIFEECGVEWLDTPITV